MKKTRRLLGIIVILVLLISSSVPFLVNTSPAAAQDGETFQLAPINPKALEPASPYGYRPPTMDLSHLEEIPVQGVRALPTLPGAWDWRTGGKVTSVKNQDPCGTCWIFGTTSVLESAVLLGESAEYDFSEQSVALCVDPSWVYLYDDSDEPCGTVPGHGGGNSIRASEVFIKKGAVLESCNPYNTGGLQCDGTCTCDSCTPVKQVTGYRYVTGDGSQTALIKAAVYDNGPVAMSFYYTPSGEYTDPTYGTIYDYYPYSESPNHLVSIIGWDDSVPYHDPDHSGTGAWLVKNSWGTGWGNSGYFWLAYDSSCMTEIAYLQYEDYDANETLYYWDEVGLIDSVGAGSNTLWGASVFTSGQDGNLTHVDFWAVSNDASYEIYVYDGSFGSQLAYQTGSCTEFGYYSIPLTTPVPMSNGQQFTVAVEMTTPGFNYPIPIEYEYTGYCEPPIQTGVCFVSIDGLTWDDAADYDWNVCLRARITTTAPPTEVWVDDNFTPETPGWGVDHFATIQDGIDAVTGSTVHVAAGTYYEHITLKDGVQVLGAGAGVTTIDGSYSGTVVTATNNVGSATKLDGFTITHGLAYNGGGMYNSDSSPTVTNCTFSGNRATYGGGMYNVEYSSPVVTNCTFSVNITDIFGYGGGMYNYNNSFPVVTNCTFSGNSAGAGGGMWNGNFSSLTVTNCILWGDTPQEIYNSSFAPVVTYCDIQGGYSGAGNINADPLFVNPSANDYHLQPGSPCIDVGNNLAPSLPSTDFEGDPRILDGDGDLNTVVDMGADEYVSLPNNPPNAPASPLCEGVTNPTDVTDPTPEFSWTFSDPDGGDTQGAYQVLVASSSGNLAADIGDMWDSGKVSGSAGEVSYADTTLTDSQTYYWKVKTWDNHDAEGTYCSQQQFTTGTFPYGLLRVQTSPAVPTTILVDGIPRNAWGLDYVKMPPGEYTLSFTDTPGYLVPEEIAVTYYPGGGPTTQPLSEPIEILPDTTTEVIVNFVQLGNLWVRTDPAVPAIISLNGAPPANNWGFWVDLLPGDYDLSISDVVGYATPAEVEVTYPGQSPITQAISEPIAVYPGGTTAVVIHFIQLGNLKVETNPMLPATIFVDGNPMNDWGCWLYLEAGEYTVSFQDIPGYITPSPVVVNVTPGVTTYVTGYYVSE